MDGLNWCWQPVKNNSNWLTLERYFIVKNKILIQYMRVYYNITTLNLPKLVYLCIYQIKLKL